MRAIRKDSLFPQVADRLRQRIETGALTGALPGVQKLALEFKVNFMTVDKALNVLSAEGLVHRVPRQGTFVSHRRTVAFAMHRPEESIRKRAIFGELIGALQQKSAEASCMLALFDLERADAVQAEMLARRVDGLITLGNEAGLELPEPLRRLPRINALGVPPAHPSADQVTIDNGRIGRMAAEYLHRRGCRKVIALAPTHHRPPAVIRSDAFVEEAFRLGMEPRIYREEAPLAEERYETLAPMLENWRRDGFAATGIFAVNDFTAAVATNFLLLQGLKPNRDVFVIGCNRPLSSFLPREYDFAYIDPNLGAIAEAALKRLFERLADPELPVKIQILQPLMIRNSVQ